MVRREFYGLNFSLKIEKKALRDDFKVFFLKKLEIIRKNAIFRIVFYFYWEYNDEETTYGSWNFRFRTPFMRVWNW